MMLLDEIKKHKIPVAVSSAGVFIAFIFAVLPLIESEEETPPPKQEAVITQNAPSVTLTNSNQSNTNDVEVRLTALETSLKSKLDNIDLQLQNMNKAVGRLNIKIVKLRESSGSDDMSETLKELSSSVNSHRGQLVILNKAAGRLHKRYVDLKASNEAQSEQLEKFSKVGERLQDLFALGDN